MSTQNPHRPAGTASPCQLAVPYAHGVGRDDPAGSPRDGGTDPQARNPVRATLDRVDVRAALQRLPEHQRRVLIEIYFRQHTVQETATALGIPAGTVTSRTFHALRQLRQALQERGLDLAT